MFGALDYMKDPNRAQQMQGLAAALESTGIPTVVDRLSYGEPLTTGTGMTTALRPESRDMMMTLMGLAPIGRPAASASDAALMAAGRAGERVAERVVPQVMERGGLPAEMLGAMAQGTQSPATVFHGSPHLFQRFDASKIGTGEGAQVYGHGLYFAESPEVADQYRKTLAHKAFAKLEKVDRNSYKVTAPDGTVISEGLPLGPSTKAKSAFDAQAGNIYQVDLPDEQIARMLDFDKPLSEQPEIVKRLNLSMDNGRVNALVDSEEGGQMLWRLGEYPSIDAALNEITGQKLNALLKRTSTPAESARVMRQAGIPGIRYLDQGSRAVPNITNQRLANLYAKHGGNAEAAVDEMMRSVYNSPKKKAEMREQFMKQLQTQTPKTSNFVVFPGMEDMLRIEQINEQPIQSLFQTLGR
jgi:hypothetical protein